ncbi:hypothetical protein RSAG8_01353, partial [Rhizoctonia solani AG-8 WAC10335]
MDGLDILTMQSCNHVHYSAGLYFALACLFRSKMVIHCLTCRNLVKVETCRVTYIISVKNGHSLPHMSESRQSRDLPSNVHHCMIAWLRYLNRPLKID